MKRFYWFLKFCFYLTLAGIVVGVGGLYAVFWSYSKDLPRIDSLKDYAPDVVSEVFANDGTKIGEFWANERRIILKENEIPKLIEQAFLASEDDRFFEHSGIDYFGIVRAMFENFKAGKVVQGGSTITQQVVKSFLLTNERTYERKIKEAILAKKIEDKLSKQEILYLYLNQIYLGNRAAGIEAAAQNYFHKSAKDLSIAEAAMIGGLAKAPSLYSPVTNFKRAKIRQEYVIERMEKNGFITSAQAKQAKAESLKLYVAPVDKEFNLRHAPWFVEDVRRMIIKKYGELAPYKRGFKIYTTLDLKADKASQKAVLKGLRSLHKRHGWSGPSQNLASETDISQFRRTQHLQILKSLSEENLYDPEQPSEEALLKLKLKLKPEEFYSAVITKVEPKKITVGVGMMDGVILPPDYGWARPRNGNTYFYEGNAQFVGDATRRFKVGDVIEVALITPAETDKIHVGEETYFSLEETPAPESALFAFDPHTGYVKAVTGGKSYKKSEFNRATQSLRQTGSVFKALLYASALEKGYTPETVIADSPLAIPDGNKMWVPKNFGGKYSGSITFRSALTNSVNVASVRILLDIDRPYVDGFVRKLGITSPVAQVWSMALGANDMRLMEITHAFGVFPTGGILQDLIFIEKVVDRDGKIIEANAPRVVENYANQIKSGKHTPVPDISYDEENIESILRPDLYEAAKPWIEADKLELSPQDKAVLYGKHLPEGYVITPKTAQTMVAIMQDVVNHGTAMRVKALGRPVGGKTGTTNDLTDVWFIGYTPDLVAGVWVGYDENKNKVGHGEQGGRTAAPIFLHFAEEYLKDTPVKKFATQTEVEDPSLRVAAHVKGADLPHQILEGDPNNANNSVEFFLNDI